MSIPITVPLTILLMLGYQFAGRAYISFFSGFGFGSRKEMLKPLLKASQWTFIPIAAWCGYTAVVLPWTSTILSAMCIGGGVMKNKLHMEADELSSLQLNLIDQTTS